MATYSPSQLGITAPSGGFQQGGWYSGRQYWGGTLSDPGVIHPSSNQQGAGQAVSDEVNRQSDKAQGHAPGTIKTYLEGERNKQQQNPALTPVSSQRPMANSGVPSQSFSDAGGGTGWDGSLMPTEQVGIDLPQLYESMYKKSGIEDLQNKLSEQEKAYIEAKGVINDNPFLSEATRVGRVAKIESLYNERTANLRGDIATKKADIETQLNLELKQMDLRSDATQLAWQQFNTLLSAGALDYASDEALANITRQTGIPSSMLKSAIHTRTKEDVQTSVIQSEDDNGNVTVSVVNTKTGEIINQQSLGAIGTKTKVSGSSGGSGSSSANIETMFIQDAISIMPSNTEFGVVGIFPQLVAKYAGSLSLDDIYELYIKSPVGQEYGVPTESRSEIEEIYDYYRGS